MLLRKDARGISFRKLLIVTFSNPRKSYQEKGKFPQLQKWHLQKSGCEYGVKMEFRPVYVSYIQGQYFISCPQDVIKPP